MWRRACRKFLRTDAGLVLAGSARELLTREVRAAVARSRCSRVLVPAFGCEVVSRAVLAAGGDPHPVDVEPETGVLDPGACRAALREPAAALVAVPLFGTVGRLRESIALARAREVPVIADCAQAFSPDILPVFAGAESCLFSFAAGKHLPLFGGGMLVRPGAEDPDPDAGDSSWAREEIAVLGAMTAYLVLWRRSVWQPVAAAAAARSRRQTRTPGSFPTLSAALGLGLLERLPAEQARRRTIEAQYRAALGGSPPAGVPLLRYPHFTATGQARDRLLSRLWRRGVWASATDFGTGGSGDRCPGAADCARRLLTLPTHAGVGPSDIRLIVDCLLEEAA
jgi:dTDP-4-amino-4,6-dideoxygalactose transaminase